MKLWHGDMMKWLDVEDEGMFCVTTNGFVKHNGECVMGKGIAAQIAKKFPYIPAHLGSLIKYGGNRVHILHVTGSITIVSLPVKYEQMIVTDPSMVVPHMRHIFTVGQMCPGYALVADTKLILRSVIQVEELMNQNKNYKFCVMPKLGCGAGALNWEKDVEPILEPLLDDRFYICDWR
jgi:O-acetyl-ADP-ribose deacetylase (regulator of RNase III)